ncbi:phosphate ABC transporter substrate-binding protein PstS [Rhodobacteraceae bacterium RKSG542]|uniref:phosphate ABC transporter substrate-binding protein PstS n=1 Tax=Pseudovibrio flavus TaxID=2529854 RepID=UPI0012BD5769|nr:phosphate ABC transporter substrate-binding protein PstS [Pseudovibrio flavus]MTI16287.1 phosphate ABC transporter substrate-binding protein PstS [Pseudovibrio flavus]
MIKAVRWVYAVMAFALIANVTTELSAQQASTESDQKTNLIGAGAGFPTVLYEDAISLFMKDHQDVVVTYVPAGTAQGVFAFMNRTADYAIAGAPLDQIEGQDLRESFLALPITSGMIGVFYNLDGIKNLRLSRQALSGIFDGSITNWNDPQIASSNDGVTLPDLPIKIIAPNLGSGATYTLTNHLKEISKVWAEVGPAMEVAGIFPDGTKFAKSNEELVELVKATPGTIGYASYAFGVGGKLQMASLENKAGQFVAPSMQSGELAVQEAALKGTDDLMVFVPDPEGTNAYPIVSFYWMLIDKSYKDTAKSDAIKELADFLLSGRVRATAVRLGYVPMPDAIRHEAKRLVKTVK